MAKYVITICFLLLCMSVAFAESDQPIAQLFGQQITENDLQISPQELTYLQKTCTNLTECIQRIKQQLLNQKIRSAIFGKFIQNNHISVSPQELNEIRQALDTTDASYPAELKNLPGFTPAALQSAQDQVYEGAVINWKVNRLLYKQYGGRIIFQQFNPTEAIDAECQYLREQETNKSFTIFDPTFRQGFWNYCTNTSGIDISKRTNMDIPWWKALNKKSH